MIKKISNLIFASAIAFVIGYGVYASRQKVELSDLTVDNIEALAKDEVEYDKEIWKRYYRTENDGFNCTKGGNETCQ
jgi:hypothetical protein